MRGSALHSSSSARHPARDDPTARRVQLELALLALAVEAKREGVRTARHARIRADLKFALTVIVVTAVAVFPGGLPYVP